MANGWRGGLLVIVVKNKTQSIKHQQETTDHITGIWHLILNNYSHKYIFPRLWNLIVTSRQLDFNWAPLANTDITHYKRGRSQLHWGSHIFTTAWKIVGKFLLLCLHATDDPYWIGGVATVMVEWFAYSPQNLPRSDKPPPQKAFCRRLACTWYATEVYVYSTNIYTSYTTLYMHLICQKPSATRPWEEVSHFFGKMTKYQLSDLTTLLSWFKNRSDIIQITIILVGWDFCLYTSAESLTYRTDSLHAQPK